MSVKKNIYLAQEGAENEAAEIMRVEAIIEDINFEAVDFEANSSALTKDQMSRLDKIAKVLKANPSIYLNVEGHADSQGDSAYNQELSQKRTENVRYYLISKGVQEKTVRSRGYGESRPVASNNTEEGRAANR